MHFEARGCPLATPNHIKFKLLKGLKLCTLPHQVQIFSHGGGGAALDPCQELCPWTPPGVLKAGLDPTRWFLRFALDVSPCKQFLKVGSPGETLCFHRAQLDHNCVVVSPILCSGNVNCWLFEVRKNIIHLLTFFIWSKYSYFSKLTKNT